MTKTASEKIFIEKDQPLTKEEIQKKLDILQTACDTTDDEKVKEALQQVVPSYHPAA